MIDISYRITRAEYLVFLLKGLFKSRFMWGIALLIFIISFLPGLLQIIQKSPKYAFDIFLLIGDFSASLFLAISFGVVFFFSSIIFGLWRLWQSRPVLTANIHHIFSPEKVVSESEYSKSEYDWRLFKRVTQDKKFFYFETFKSRFRTIIPKRAFKNSADLENFIVLLNNKKLLLK